MRLEQLLTTLLTTLVESLVDQMAVFRLRLQIARLKAENYDRLAEVVIGLRQALETHKRAVSDLDAQIEERDKQIAQLRAEYASLQARQSEAGDIRAREERLNLFQRLRPVVTQLPTLRVALENGADIEGRDVVDLLGSIEAALHELGFESIAKPGMEVPYDPRRHKLVGRGARSASPGAPVRVRYVGYLYQGEVVCKAEVTPVGQAGAAP